MCDANDNDGMPAGGAPSGAGRAPLTLKPRVAGSVNTGTVRQSFSHGRSKTVVVETKRRRTDTPGAPAEKHPAFDLKPHPRPAAPAPQASAPREAQPAGGLSAEEMEARRRAIDTARQDQERREAEQRAIAAQRRAEEDARRAAVVVCVVVA